jgi:GNAT superfamily N-acetyltransferase
MSERPSKPPKPRSTADAQVRMEIEGGQHARCGVWWNAPPTYAAHRVGRIGEFEADSDRVAAVVLERACEQLAAQGCTLAVGPMDGSTWHSYRFVTERGSEPAFFLEPHNPDEWPSYFRAAGFEALAHYTSALDRGLEIRDPKAPEIEQKLASRGVRIRPLDLQRFETEMRAIHRVSLASFARNFLYSPIGEEEFVAMYAPLREMIDPSIVFIAEHDGSVAGFVFGLPDLLRPQRGLPADTMIVKTLARDPDVQYAGLGGVLLERCRSAAHERGYTRCIHALMYDENASVDLSERFGATMRGYTLFAKELAGA